MSDISGSDAEANTILGQLLLPLEPECARHARRFIATSVEAWLGQDAEQFVYEAQTVISEIVTNAVVHVRKCDLTAETCHIWIYRNGADGLRVEVHDPCDELPTVLHAETLDVSGRGLLIVKTLVETRGGKLDWYPMPRGKCVAFTLPWRPY